MSKQVLRVAIYRFRATFGKRWPGYLALILIIAAIGGVAMAAVAGARRTQSAFPVYLKSTNPSDLQAFTEFDPITGVGYSPKVDRAVSKIRYVKRSVDVIGFDGTLQVLGTQGKIRSQTIAGEAPPSVEGSLNGEYLTQDRVSLVKGRMANPNREDEFVMSAGAAAEEGLRLGSKLPVAFFRTAQVNSPKFAGYPKDHPYLLIDLKLVGIVQADFQVVEDDDASLGDQFAVLSPALTRRLTPCCAYYSYVGLQLQNGAQHEAYVLAAVKKITPNLGAAGGSQTDAPEIARVERAIRPQDIAFGAFGLIAGIAVLLIGGQIIARLTRRNQNDGAVLRALGAGPSVITADGLIGIGGSVVAGSLLALAVAVGLSPLAPFGAVRSVYPDSGITFDWTVLGSGFSLLLVTLGATAVLTAYRLTPHRDARTRAATPHESSVGPAAATAGLPPAAAIGIRSALHSGYGRDASPVRSVMLGAVLATVVLVTAVTFGASLNSLVSRPALYGWNWNYVLLSGFSGAEDLPAAETAELLNQDADVARWTGVYFEHVTLDGQGFPALATSPNAQVAPPLLSGHALRSSQQVVLGTATLAMLHKHVGDMVTAYTGGKSPIRLRIVGTATLPTIGGSGSPNLQMGRGAVISAALYPPNALNDQGSPVAGPMAELITMRPGVERSVALDSLNRIVQSLNQSSDGPVGGVVSVLRPAVIAYNRSVGATPFILAGILAAGAVGALGLTLVASVRGRRREFALLKALGFTQRQLAVTVAWQSSMSAMVGIIFGLPLGIAIGRWLWILFARGISAVPDPVVPVWSVVLIAVGALVFANLVAAIPGRVAARTPTALLLRTE
ncbi:MAG: FtsX-like permease family protein [Acidimicrobiales bacterium]